MDRNRKWTIALLAALLLVTCCAAAIHLTGRTAADGVLLVEYPGGSTEIGLASLAAAAVQVQGQVVDGRSEVRKISSPGIPLSRLLSDAGISVQTEVTVIADDEYSAVVTAEELREPDRVFLLLTEGRPQLLVFGDPNSKRNVSGVVRVVVS